MPWGGAEGQNIEHPHTPVNLSSFCFLCRMHFNFIVKARFRRATLSCDSTGQLLLCGLLEQLTDFQQTVTAASDLKYYMLVHSVVEIQECFLRFIFWFDFYPQISEILNLEEQTGQRQWSVYGCSAPDRNSIQKAFESFNTTLIGGLTAGQGDKSDGEFHKIS